MTRYRLNEIKTEIDVPMSDLPSFIARRTGISESDIVWWEIRRKSTDSRKKPHIQYVYTVDFATERKIRKASRVRGLDVVDQEKEQVKPPQHGTEKLRGRPVVVGLGPAGLFAAITLVNAGLKVVLLDRGKCVE